MKAFVSSAVAMYPPTRSGTNSVASTNANGSFGASGVGTYAFGVTDVEAASAAFSKFAVISSGEMSLIEGTTMSSPGDSVAMSAP